MNERIIFLRIGWMAHYHGLGGDYILGGGAFVQQEHFGYEIFNFQPFDGQNYGYVGVTEEAPRIDITNLEATKTDSDYVPSSSRSGGLARVVVFLGARASRPLQHRGGSAPHLRARRPRSQDGGPRTWEAIGLG